MDDSGVVADSEARTDILNVQGRMTMGYGIIPKLPMKDKRLTIEAKAIYAYFCSYAGAGSTAFPSRSKILFDLQIGEDRYYKHFKLLKEHGYISVNQTTDNAGKFKRNIYTLVEMIEPISQGKSKGKKPYPENKGTEKQPYPYFPGTVNPDTEEPYAENTGANNISSVTINSITISNQSINHSNNKNIDEIDRIDKNTYLYYMDLIKENISYDILIAEDFFDNHSQLDEIVNIIVETVCSTQKTIRVNKEDRPQSLVHDQLLKLNSEHIKYVIQCFNKNTTKISNVKAFLLTALYNAPFTIDNYYQAAVNHDFYGTDSQQYWDN